MNQDREQLIDDLVADLRPVHRPGRIGPVLAMWLVIASGYSLLMTLATGPMRPGAAHDLFAYPLFAAETLLAMLAIVVLARGALRSAIPGGRDPVAGLWRTLLPLAAWVGVYVAGFWHPVHPVSTLGDRGVCEWQVLLFSLPILGLLLWYARRLFPLHPRLTGLLAGAAAAAIPGALMQFGCMYGPAHILLFHLAPIVPVAVIGALLAPRVLAVRSTVPRRRSTAVH